MKLHKNLFDIKVLDTAIKTTFEYRSTTIEKTEFKELLRFFGSK